MFESLYSTSTARTHAHLSSSFHPSPQAAVISDTPLSGFAELYDEPEIPSTTTDVTMGRPLKVIGAL